MLSIIKKLETPSSIIHIGKKHIGKYDGGITVNNKIVDSKEEKVMYTGVNIHWS